MDIYNKFKSGGKLNYLLVMPRIASSARVGYGFPLGIAYVSSSLKKAGFRVSTINLNNHMENIWEALASEIKNNNIDVVMTGGLSAQFNIIKPVLDMAKKINGDIITVVGGGIITAEPEIAMEALELADIGVIGEGELTVVELASALENGHNFNNVNGLIFKNAYGNSRGEHREAKDCKYEITGRRKEIEDLDTIPWPDYEGFEIAKYLSSIFSGTSTVGSNILPMIASRSCPYSCTFCFHTVGRKYRQRSLDDIFKELDYLMSKYKIETLDLNDELFARDVPRLRDYCARIKKRNIKWYSSFRVDDMTEETIELVKDSRCSIMGFGLESADNRILKSMRKGITVEQIERTLALIDKAKMPIGASFIFGDIEETFETANNTIDWWCRHREYNITLLPIAAYPGTHLYKYACEKGIITDRVQFLKDGCPPVNVSKMTDSQFGTIMKRTMDVAIQNTKELTSFSFSNANRKDSVIDITGKCNACGEKNEWRNVRLFNNNCRIACHQCGQQYRPSLDKSTRSNIDVNMTKLLGKYEKIAVWGMVCHSVDIFCTSDVLRSPNIYPIDIASSKAGMVLNGKQVSSPDIIEKEKIELVIISALNHFSVIEYQMRNNYKNVKKIINITSLLGDGSDLDC